MTTDLHVITGAFGFSGRYIADRLLAANRRVRTLTNSRRGDPFGGRVDVAPLDFQHPDRLTASLEGAAVLYNTYWVRFDHADFSHQRAVANTLVLFEAAKRAGVRRVVHVSITNPDEKSQLPYFRGKAELESALQRSGLSYAIQRPALLFGREDILVNNIAWVLRRLPVFGVFGDGQYRLQPIFVDDFAGLAVDQGLYTQDVVIDAIGPETLAYRELVELVARSLGLRRRIMSVSPGFGYAVGRIVGRIVGDVVITREEIQGLMEGRLATGSPAAGATLLSAWLVEHRDEVGRRYASELARRRDRSRPYASL
jgi:uncharacterized protein YbjT (DUF2867 family)